MLGLSLVEGRLLDERDERGGPPVIVVDRAWARRFFPHGGAVGQRLHEGGCATCPWLTVVGVVSDVKYSGLDAPDEGSVYQTLAARGPDATEQAKSRFRYLLLRTSADPARFLPAVQQVLRDLDPSLPLSSVATIDELVGRELQVPRSLSLLVGGFAIVALLLSTVGIYGVMAYYVEQHAKEIGIRLALGGSRGAVMRLVVGQGMRVVTSGVVVGALAALGLDAADRQPAVRHRRGRHLHVRGRGSPAARRRAAGLQRAGRTSRGHAASRGIAQRVKRAEGARSIRANRAALLGGKGPTRAKLRRERDYRLHPRPGGDPGRRGHRGKSLQQRVGGARLRPLDSRWRS